MNGLYYPNARYEKNDIDKEEEFNYSLAELFKNNVGKKIKIFLSFPNINELKSFEGILERVSNEYLIITSPPANKWEVLLLSYIAYAEIECDT